ncbi:hypothetical protein HYFRA_00005455 [Hymenoscyphus fraxineus]|uniref:Uncharacterized protein n=1 Tax=Hymenoscyphus fraxineus TaxID=746836 RepID=A0A9N9KPI8_9HELO|nr:hypothetical protein HYFRA_00005455 [Hymenoscyphus fraxineus]
MIETGDPNDVEVEMHENGRLLGDADIEEKDSQQQAPKRLVEWLFWGFLILVCVVLLSDNIRLRLRQSSVSAFNTDLTVAKPISELIEYQFTGGIQVDHDGKLYREVNPLEPQYAGEPSPEIDKAWDDLLSAVDLSLDISELHGVEKTSVHTADGKSVLISLDVYHSLHCIDLVRKAIDFRYYHPTGHVPYFYRSHVDHCVDYLRQAIQCQSDLSPLTYTRTEPKNRTIPVFGTAHTCRNFSKVHEWAMERRSHGDAV